MKVVAIDRVCDFSTRVDRVDYFHAELFHGADDHVFAATAPPQGFAEHAKRFSNAGSVAQKKLEHAARFLRRRGNFQPFFRFLEQLETLHPAGAWAKMYPCRDFSVDVSWEWSRPYSLSPALCLFIATF